MSAYKMYNFYITGIISLTGCLNDVMLKSQHIYVVTHITTRIGTSRISKPKRVYACMPLTCTGCSRS